MAVEHSATTYTVGEGLSATVAHNPSGSNRLLLVGVAWSEEAQIESLTFGGVAMTSVVTVGANGMVLSVFRTIAPPTGSANVIAVLDIAAAYVVAVMSYVGVHQVTPIGAVASTSATSTDIAATVDPTTEGGMVADFAVVAAGPNTVAGSPHGAQIERVDQAGGTSPLKVTLLASDDEAGGAATMAWTIAPSKPWAQYAMELRAAASGVAGIRRGPPIGRRLIRGGG